MGMSGMGHHGKPNMNEATTQVAPAVTAMLLPAARACSGKPGGSGFVRMIPVHVGHMSGPHVTVDLTLHRAGMMHTYGISGQFVAKPPVQWSGMVESDTTDMHGNLKVKTRLMPMLRPGRYTARIMLHDMACGGAHHPLAYETRATKIVLR